MPNVAWMYIAIASSTVLLPVSLVALVCMLIARRRDWILILVAGAHWLITAPMFGFVVVTLYHSQNRGVSP